MDNSETITETTPKKGAIARGFKRAKKLKPPSDFAVVFYNDNYTPMEFVTFILIEIFRHSMERAHQIMLNVHEQGSGVAGIFRFEIAEEKASDTLILAEEHQYPLKVSIEKL